MWLNRLLSTPTIGIHMTQDYHYLDNLVSFYQKLADDGMSIKIKDNNFEVKIDVGGGFEYIIKPEDLIIRFVYPMEWKTQHGDFPILKSDIEIKPYTVLLDSMIDKICYVFDVMFRTLSRKIKRIGIVSTSDMEIDKLPPGIERFKQHLSSPWKSELDSYSASITPLLPSSEENKVKVRCIHSIIKEEEKSFVRCQLDWQQFFLDPSYYDNRKLKKLLEDAKLAATTYFIKFGEGDLDYV